MPKERGGGPENFDSWIYGWMDCWILSGTIRWEFQVPSPQFQDDTRRKKKFFDGDWVRPGTTGERSFGFRVLCFGRIPLEWVGIGWNRQWRVDLSPLRFDATRGWELRGGQPGCGAGWKIDFFGSTGFDWLRPGTISKVEPHFPALPGFGATDRLRHAAERRGNGLRLNFAADGFHGSLSFRCLLSARLL